MPGERTPDSSSSKVNGSSDDDISLREHLQRQLDTMRAFVVRLDDDQTKYFERVIADLSMHLDERYQTQTKALEAAFAAAERAVQAALLAAEKAVQKAEAAAEKRFEGVNEFRGQLSDQARTFMPRSEAEVRINALAEKDSTIADRISKLELTLTNRLASTDGRSTGIDKTVGWIFAGAGFVATVLAIAYAVAK